jgi:formylglycine-generating enzyme required for sulfatase activity
MLIRYFVASIFISSTLLSQYTFAVTNTEVLELSQANPEPAMASAAEAEQVTFEWLTVGNPGNAADISSGFGAVDHTFLIAKYEVTNQQYAQFLNAKAVSDSLNLYSVSMGAGAGGITRSGVPGSYSYTAMPGREQKPVNWVSYYDVLRFSNWMHNGQGDGDTETGAYTLEGGMAVPFNAETVQRNPDARVFIPTEDEWYKSAYHNATGLIETDYVLYPFRSDDVTTCSPPPGGVNHANCARAVTDVVDRGSYPESIGPYGTFDQGGNVWEWNVGMVAGVLPVMRGGGYYIGPDSLASSWRDQWLASGEFSFAGFRLAAPASASGTNSAVAAGSSGGGGGIGLLILLLPLLFAARGSRSLWGSAEH